MSLNKEAKLIHRIYSPIKMRLGIEIIFFFLIKT